MNISTEAFHTGEYLISEANGTRSREEIVCASGHGVLPAGQVLGKVTASGKYAPYSNAANDGTEAAAGILYASVDTTSSDAAGVGHVRDCEVASALLTGLDANGTADLKAIGIIVR